MMLSDIIGLGKDVNIIGLGKDVNIIGLGKDVNIIGLGKGYSIIDPFTPLSVIIGDLRCLPWELVCAL
jgi:hypothetical protein